MHNVSNRCNSGIPTINQPLYARPKEACRHLQISRSTLWHWCKTRPDFPKPIKAGQRVTLFNLNAIDAWLQSQKEVA